MRLLITSRFNSEQGQASLFLLFGVTISLLAIALLFFRLGDAHDMRTNTQSAADAAALAAVGDIEDRAAEAIADNRLPNGVGWQKSTGKPKAESYAEKNNGSLAQIRASDDDMGRSGNIVRVEVSGDRCQRELQDDGSVHWNHRECPDKEEIEEAERRGEEIPTLTGNAAAIAKVTLPDCRLREWEDWLGTTHSYVVCRKAGSGAGYERVWTAYQAKQMTEVELVDQEGQWIFAELTGGPGTGRYACEAAGQQNITPTMCDTHNETLNKWGAALEEFDPPGCYRAAEDGGDHPRGNACDYAIGSIGAYPNQQMIEVGDALTQWLIDNHEELSIKYVIWDGYIWESINPAGDWPQVRENYTVADDVTGGHYDHVHVSVSAPPAQ